MARDLESQLAEFCEKWIAMRVALVEKHELRFQRWKNNQLILESEQRKIRHYKHELAMLRELRRRTNNG